jgi:protein-S-isoprenylcysteine O-methyltransferase Ste14
MRRLLLSLALFTTATLVNTGSVALQQRTAWLTRRFRRRGWYAHLALIAPAWLAFLVSLPILHERVRWPLPRALRPAGNICLVVAAAVWMPAFAALGPVRAANGDQFGRARRLRIRHGIFRSLANPMYDGYALAFIGTALRSGNAVFLPLAGTSYLLLNQIEARVENAAADPPSLRE